MKQLSLLLMLLVLAVSGYAQQGLFGLSYGDSYDTAKSILGTDPLDFSETDFNGTCYTYMSPTNGYIEEIRLYFNEDGSDLMMWQILYIEQEDEYAEDVAYDAAYEWHGEETEWDDDFELYVWSLGDGKTLRIGYSTEWWVTAEYSSPGYEEYTVFY